MDVGTKAQESFLQDIGTGGVLAGNRMGMSRLAHNWVMRSCNSPWLTTRCRFPETPSIRQYSSWIGIIPFVFVSGAGAPATIANVTDSQFRNCVGGAGNLNLWTGNHADSGTPVWVAGRDLGLRDARERLRHTVTGSRPLSIRSRSTAGPVFTDVANQGQSGGGAGATD